MKCLEKVKDALLTVTDNVWHYEALKQDERYIVWAEDVGADQLNADNHMRLQAIQGTIDLYTSMENDPYVDQIQTALNNARISFSLNSVQYEDDTKLIHFEWLFEVS